MNTNIVVVPFHGQSLLATSIDGTSYVAMKPICENIGLQWEAQLKRIKRHPVLSSAMSMMDIPSNGGIQQMVMLPIKYLNGWLFGIDSTRVKPEIKDRVIEYQRECFEVLANHFMPQLKQNPEPPTKKALPNGLSLEQQDTIKALIKSRAESLPKEQQGKAIITCWSALKTKFGYKKPETYKNIKPEDFNTAISLLARLPLDGELIENQQDKITIELKPLVNGEIRRVLITQLANGHTTVWDLPKDIRMHTLDEFVNIVQKHYVMINRNGINDITIKQLTELLGYGFLA